MSDILEKIGQFGLVPIIKIYNVNDAILLAKALIKAGLPVAEITFRTAAAEEVIKKLNKDFPEILLGAGTVLNIEQTKKAVSAGAKFIVSPGFNPKIVDYCIENDIPVTPGVNNPTQIEMALEKNLKVVKFFPAEASGGLKLLKSMSAPYSGIKFIPTGGINQENILSYLSFDKVHACGGSWIVKTDLISSGNFNEITRRIKEAISIILGFEFAHLGINKENEEDSRKSAEIIAHLFNFPLKEGTSSIFVGKELEIVKGRSRGRYGHIAIGTDDIPRALGYLEMKGVSIIPETSKEKDGKLIAVYLDKEIDGFAVHLLQK